MLKDDGLVALSTTANIAQFVSFSRGPSPQVRHVQITHFDAGEVQRSPQDILQALIARAGRVNIRSYEPSSPKSKEFIYGLSNVDEVMTAVRRLAAAGLYTIVNETVEVNDGGVSGVVLGDIIEFVPGDTPRGVEKPGTCSLPRAIGTRILRAVYGFSPSLDYPPNVRVEFSIHPQRVGTRHSHTLVWEREDVGLAQVKAAPRWPNRFSRHIGDKTFGLLLADALDIDVPATQATARRVAPFRFGHTTGTGEVWLRTAPAEQVPGHFTTQRGWVDPFALMAKEDPESVVMAVLAQEGVDAAWSGATMPAAGNPIVEGVRGFGDRFMQGEQSPDSLPKEVVADVQEAVHRLRKALGDTRLEWAHDGSQVWIIQLHMAGPMPRGVVSPGDPREWIMFEPQDGLERLRSLIRDIGDADVGVEIGSPIGITSHVGDILRRARIPARLAEVPTE